MEWFFGLPTEWQAMLVLTWGAPYIGLVTGYLTINRNVKLWMTLYFDSEDGRKRGLAAMERGADAIEAAVQVINSTLTPIKERMHDDSA